MSNDEPKSQELTDQQKAYLSAYRKTLGHTYAWRKEAFKQSVAAQAEKKQGIPVAEISTMFDEIFGDRE